MGPGFESLKVHKTEVKLGLQLNSVGGRNSHKTQVVSDSNAEGPPVPIPNTEVKLCSGDNTWLETAREDSSSLTLRSRLTKLDGFFYIPP